MFLVILFVLLMIAVPAAAWQKYRSSSSLFVSATSVCVLYALTMASIHGLSKTFPWEQTQTTLVFWRHYILSVASFAIPAAILFVAEKFGVAPNRRVTLCFFWIYNFATTTATASAHLISGFQYPPLGLEIFSPDQFAMINTLIVISNFMYLHLRWVFFALAAWPLILRLPTWSKKVLIAIRYM